MKVSYDPTVDAVYFRFVEGQKEVRTKRLTDDIAINFGSKGELVGIEVLSAHRHLKFSRKKPQIKLENLKAA